MHPLLRFWPLSLLLIAGTCADELPAPATLAPTSTTVVLPMDSDPTTAKTATPPPPPWFLHPITFDDVMDGETVYQPATGLETLLRSSLPTPDLGTLLPPGEPVQLIALGGGLTAGVRNGGLYREGQLTAYPNLVARQMGLNDFASPLFGPEEANGTGFLIYSDKNAAYPRWKRVTNQVAPIKEGNPPQLSPYVDVVRNYGSPGLSSYEVNSTWNPNGNWSNGTGNLWLPYQLYLWRMFPAKQNESLGLVSYIRQNQPYTLYFIQDILDGWMNAIKRNNRLNKWDMNAYIYRGQSAYESALRGLSGANRKGIIFNLPDYRDLPIMHWFSIADLKKNTDDVAIVYYRDGPLESKVLDTKKECYFLPTKKVADLFASSRPGERIAEILTDADVMDSDEAQAADPGDQNRAVKVWADRYGVSVVDLYTLYKKIRAGNYVTVDGLRIDGTRQGNFFSSDGIYPTAIGQAVIANEVINVLNSTYKARIPLINVTEFARTVGNH